MPYEWYEAKRRTNRAKHGIDFTAVYGFDWDTASTRVSVRHDEMRFVATGYLGDRIHVVVYTMRGDRMRIISMRKAKRREEEDYAQSP